MRKPAVMIQGTGSNVGKSLLVAGLCRHFARQGLKVFPFKPQNMSNNAAVTTDGGEIGRAQALQARAAGVPLTVDLNPVLLKPESEKGAQLVVHGKRRATMKARDYGRYKQELLPDVVASFDRLQANADLILVEGAGSPAEVNLRDGDIANMGFAEAADIPVILAGDIDKGGVIAALAGTHLVLPASERDRIKGFLVNKFRGDISLFTDGLRHIEDLTGWAALGVVPWFDLAHRLPAEDAQSLGSMPGDETGGFKVAVPVFSRIANFDDLDPLRLQPGVSVTMIRAGEPIPAPVDLIILPGSKSTTGDLAFLRRQGWDIDIAAHIRRGGRVLGICGGYQMLGREIRDPGGIEGEAGSVNGLGHLDIVTELSGDKQLRQVSGRHAATETPFKGYEIHLGRSEGPDCARPLFQIGDASDGATSPDGRVMGSYVHGMFSENAFRAAFLKFLGAGGCGVTDYDAVVDTTLDDLADHLAAHVDMDAVFKIAASR